MHSQPATRPGMEREGNRPRELWRLLVVDGDGAWAATARAALSGIAEVDWVSSEASATAALQAGLDSMEPHAGALITGELSTVDRARALWGISPELEITVVSSAPLRAERFARPEQVTVLVPPVDGEGLRVAVAGAQARFARRALTRAAGERARLTAVIADLDREVAWLRDEARRRHEGDLERARLEKLESLGRLAAGLAHEINTPLQFLGDNLTFLAESFGTMIRLAVRQRGLHREVASGLSPEQALVRADQLEVDSDFPWIERNLPLALDECNQGLRRVREIVQTMKEFALPSQRALSDCDVNEALMRALVVARGEYEQVAEIETDLDDVPRARCAPDDLHQVLYNLIVNAAQAISEHTGGRGRGVIRLASRLHDDQVVITVSDDGCGIPEHLRPRIFEHFFTTREVGRGTGQGLALAWSLVAQKHGGTLRFESEVGRGTTFEVRLRRYEGGGGEI